MIHYALVLCSTSLFLTGAIAQLKDDPTANKLPPPLAIVSITVTPPNSNPTSNIRVGNTEQLTATATFADGSTTDVTSSSIWGTFDPTTASVSNTAGSIGLVSGLQQGKTNVSATYFGVAGQSVVAVGITSIAITPTSVFLLFNQACNSGPHCSAIRYTATGKFDDGTMIDVTNGVQWVSSDTSVLTIDNTGHVTFVSPLALRPVNVTATLVNVTSNSAVVRIWRRGGTIRGSVTPPAPARCLPERLRTLSNVVQAARFA